MPLPITQPTKENYPELIDVWEASVRATHHFLAEEDILYFRQRILDTYFDLVQLHTVRDENDQIAGFLGLSDDKIEMLFIRPDQRGRGIGKQLLDFAIQEKGFRFVDVNEQNEQAVGFYKKLGFKVIARHDLDPEGRPYPILEMAL